MGNMKIKLKKIFACFELAAIADAIGFYNGQWEFNYGNIVQNEGQHEFIETASQMSNHLVFLFVASGGINRFDMEGLRVSDDTMMSLALCDALSSKYNTKEELLSI